MSSGVSRAEVGPVVRLTTFTCTTCGCDFPRPAMRGRPPTRCTDCKKLRRSAPRPRMDTNTVNYRWAHAVATQRLGVELARTGLRTALLGTYDGRKLEQAVRQALADLDAVVGYDNRTAGA